MRETLKKYLLTQLLIVICCSCSLINNQDDTKLNTVGSDRDQKGCIASAGYQWCESTNQCERPWELANKEGFANNKESFSMFCQGKADKPLLP